MKECFICKGQPKFYVNWRNYKYVQCANCGLVYLETMPTEAEMYAAYDGGKWKSLRRKLVAPFRNLEHFSGFKERVMDFDTKIQAAMPFLDPSLNKKVLDIGCNKGFFLTAAINRGYEAYGLELVPELTIQFKRKYKQFASNIYPETISTGIKRFKNGEFGLVTAFDVVEHLRNPREDFQDIFRVLQPNGVFFLQTPNIDSDVAKQLGDQWGAFKAFEHYHLFNEKNLELFAKQIGFRKVDFLDPNLTVYGNLLAILTK